MLKASTYFLWIEIEYENDDVLWVVICHFALSYALSLYIYRRGFFFHDPKEPESFQLFFQLISRIVVV